MKTNLPPSAPPADELDLTRLWFQMRLRWPLFAGALLLSGVLGYTYLQWKAPVYGFKATMLLGDQATGSKRAQELLQILEVRDKGLKMEDEVGLISSAATVRQAVRRLPFAVAYYAVPDSWLNKVKTWKIREKSAAEVPFRVGAALGVPQLAGVPIYVSPAGAGRYRLQGHAKRGQLVDLRTGQVIKELGAVKLDVMVTTGDTLRHPWLRVVLTPGPAVTPVNADRFYFTLNDVDAAAGRFADGLAVRPIDHDSRIVELKAKGPVPAHVLMFLDTLMATYVANDLQAKDLTGRKTLAFLDEEIAKLARSRRQAAGALSSFRTTRGVVDVGGQSASGIQRLGDLEMARARIATSRRLYQNLLEPLHQARATGHLAAPSSAGLDDPALNNLIVQLADLNGKRAALGLNASAANPVVAMLDERLHTTQDALILTLTSMIRAADIGLRDLDAQLGQVRGQMSRMPEDERQLSSLKSESDFNEKNYNFLVEKRNEAGLALATNTTDKRPVDRAQATSVGPEAPNPKLVALVALLAGLLLPAGLALLLDKTNTTIQSQSDLAQLTDIPVLGVVAHGSRKDKAAMLYSPKGAITESFRSIRVNFQYLAAGRDKQVLGVTSSVSGEGKTFCAVNLAAELASTGQHVLLLETDLRRPTVARYFGPAATDPAHGLATYLSGRSTLDDCRHPSGIADLDVLPCGPVPANPTYLLEGPRMSTLLTALRQHYDYIVIDTPPVGFVAEYFVLLAHLDAHLYVVRHNYTNRALLGRMDELHRDGKIKQLYLIINDMKFDKSYENQYRTKAYSYYK